MSTELLRHRGHVEHLCINGEQVSSILFGLEGPRGDRHAGFTRKTSGHDSALLRLPHMRKGMPIANMRTWSAISKEEMDEVGAALSCEVPMECLLANLCISDIPRFSQLEVGMLLVFPSRCDGQEPEETRAILYVGQENTPCAVVGNRLEKHHQQPGLSAKFVHAANGKRGLVGSVLSPGRVLPNDEVLVYPPIRR